MASNYAMHRQFWEAIAEEFKVLINRCYRLEIFTTQVPKYIWVTIMSSHVLRELVLFGEDQSQIWDEPAASSPNIIPGELVAQLQLLKVYCLEYNHLLSHDIVPIRFLDHISKVDTHTPSASTKTFNIRTLRLAMQLNWRSLSLILSQCPALKSFTNVTCVLSSEGFGRTNVIAPNLRMFDIRIRGVLTSSLGPFKHLILPSLRVLRLELHLYCRYTEAEPSVYNEPQMEEISLMVKSSPLEELYLSQGRTVGPDVLPSILRSCPSLRILGMSDMSCRTMEASIALTLINGGNEPTQEGGQASRPAIQLCPMLEELCLRPNLRRVTPDYTDPQPVIRYYENDVQILVSVLGELAQSRSGQYGTETGRVSAQCVPLRRITLALAHYLRRNRNIREVISRGSVLNECRRRGLEVVYVNGDSYNERFVDEHLDVSC